MKDIDQKSQKNEKQINNYQEILMKFAPKLK